MPRIQKFGERITKLIILLYYIIILILLIYNLYIDGINNIY